MKAQIKKLYYILSCKLHGFPTTCIIKSKKMKNASFEGYNYVEKEAMVYDSSIGFSSCIGLANIIDKTIVGKYTCLGPRVRVVRGNHPSRTIVATHPNFYSPNHPCSYLHIQSKNAFDDFKYVDNKRKICCFIGSDVWVGSDVIILEGHTIGDGAIIAAGSVVVKDIPPYEIWGGNPAKFIRKRFTDSQIETLLKTRWWDWDVEKLRKYADCFLDIEVFCNYAEKGKFIS